MIFDWYALFNLDEFMDTELTSRELIVLLEGIGRVSILVSRGNTVSLTYDGVFLPLNFIDQNPYVDGIYASYVDDDNQVWLGREVAS